jgi:hypothetical protein
VNPTWCGHGEILDATEKLVVLNKTRSECVAGEIPVAVATGNALGKNEIVNIQAEGDSNEMKSARTQALLDTGATGLEPAASGVTGATERVAKRGRFLFDGE